MTKAFIGDIIEIGENKYYIECSELYQMPGNDNGLFLQKIEEED